MSGGIGGHLISGFLLGAAWSPCIGPTLGGRNIFSRTGIGGQSIAYWGMVPHYDEFRTGHIDNYFAFGLRCPRYDKQAAG